MFGIGPMELIVIAIVAMVFIGPERLPDVMRKFGRMFVQIRRQANEVKSGFNDVIQDAEREFELERIRELQHKLASTTPKQILEAAVNGDPTQMPKPINPIGPGVDEHGHPRPGFDSHGVPLPVDDANVFDYHEDHYVDGKYVKPDEGFIPWDPSMDRPLSEMFPLPKENSVPAATDAAPTITAPKPMADPTEAGVKSPTDPQAPKPESK